MTDPLFPISCLSLHQIYITWDDRCQVFFQVSFPCGIEATISWAQPPVKQALVSLGVEHGRARAVVADV